VSKFERSRFQLCCYDKTGNIISFESMVELKKEDPGYFIVQKDTVGKVEISTVLLWLDHRFINGGDPIIFETMIFGGKHDDYCDRYCTEEEAKDGHKKALNMVINE